jgi:demethylmenaquinone methyltransferase / 2-methoxy-6-polyprenyl-1,4-benzoquinol methylase
LASQTERDKSRAVREMFGAIAGRYDFLNHFLSLNIDRLWRRACLREVGKALAVPRPKILDVGCGTADLSIEFSSLGPVVGCDFCHPMLQLGLAKLSTVASGNPISLLEGDALQLPFADASFDAVVSAFVLRNLANTSKGLSEMRRILRPGGVMGLLDFGIPGTPVLRRFYLFYFQHVLPRLGRIFSGVNGPYKYLPDSVKTFPPAEELSRSIAESGFAEVKYRKLTGGVAVLFIART